MCYSLEKSPDRFRVNTKFNRFLDCSLSGQRFWLSTKTTNTEDQAVPKTLNDFKSFLVFYLEKNPTSAKWDFI